MSASPESRSAPVSERTASARGLVLTHHRADEDAGGVDERPLDFGLIKRLFQYTRPHARVRNALFGLVILRSIQIPTVAWALGSVINGPITGGRFRDAVLGALGYLGVMCFTEFVLHFRQKLALRLGESVVHDLRQELFERLMRMPLGYYDKTKLGRIISRVTSDVESVRSGVQDVFFVSMVLTGQMIVSALMMAWLDGVMFLMLLGMAPIVWALNRFFRHRVSKATRATQESFSRVTATLAESVHGIRVTQGFGREDVNAGIFQRLVQNHSLYNLAMARASAIFLPLMELNTQFFTAMLLLVGGYRVIDPEIRLPVGHVIQFFFLSGIFFQPVTHLGRLFGEALTAMAGAERVFRLFDAKPDWEDAPDATDLPRLSGRVHFRDVCFAYDPEHPVLFNINIAAEPGQMMALVGHTGSGKSTITNILAKFYLATSGEVFMDGHEIHKIRGDALHRQMGIIQQENFLFSGTIMENIRLGRPDASDTDVLEAARKLDCLDLLEALPNGFQTQVGERGGSLSLGQRQIVCFVRAMIADPRILVLDEATSSVDAMTEARIQKSLATLMRGRTTFVVAHRLSTVRHADQVLVLERGRIVEQGRHLDLLAENGLYTELFRQFMRAAEDDAKG